MTDESDEKRLVRFDLPRGLDAASIAKSIRENCRRILDEAAAEKAQEAKPVRFDFPTGASADAIAKALTEARKRIMAEHAAKQEAAGHAAPDASPSPGSDQAKERPPEPPGVET
jgi:hypothetical protein